MGKIILLAAGDTTRLRSDLPTEWEVETVEDASLDAPLDDCVLACFMPGSFRAGERAELYDRLSRQAAETGIPLLLVADARRPETVIGLRDVNAGPVLIRGIDRYPDGFSGTLRELAFRPVVERVQELVMSAPHLPPPLRMALRRLIGQVPLPPPDAAELLGAQEAPFMRRVEDLAPLARCSRSYIYDMARAAGVTLSEVVRRNTTLHGMVLWYSEESYADIGVRLGYSGAWGWRMVVRRDLNVPVLDAVRRPAGWFAERVAAAVGRGSS